VDCEAKRGKGKGGKSSTELTTSKTRKKSPSKRNWGGEKVGGAEGTNHMTGRGKGGYTTYLPSKNNASNRERRKELLVWKQGGGKGRKGKKT